MGYNINRLAAAFATWGFALGAHSAGMPVPQPFLDDEPGAHAEARVQPVDGAKGLAKAGELKASHARPVVLDAPSAVAIDAGMRPASRNAPLQVGFARRVPALDSEAGLGSALAWEPLPGGSQVAALSVRSTGASSVRVALRTSSLPGGTVIRFKSPDATELFEVAAEDVNASIERNIEAGDRGPEARLYWSPLIDGDTVIVEVQVAAGVDPSALHIAIPHVSHLVTSAAKNFVVATKSASCEVDAMCSSGWTAQMNAVARMIFSDTSGSYLCTGTLLADQDPNSTVPYFLSANHCISTQSVASSLTTYWFYRSSSCNSGTVGPYRQLTGGATLLYASGQVTTPYSDTSFMRLNSAPPAGAVYAGWFAGATPGIGTLATGLHHPGGDWLKISSGSITGYLNCTAPSSGQFSCNSAGSTGAFYDVIWTSGITEPGSSGSGLFRSDGALIGQLYGGTGDCTVAADDMYGRFDIAYNAALNTWLSGQALTVARSGSGSGTVTSSPAGINCGATCTASFAAGTSVTLSATPATGSIFTGWSGACAGTGACVVTMNSPASVTATFASGSVSLNVTSFGGGTIISAPAGINCGATCSASFAPGTAVTLTAVPGTGMVFNGWGGACSGTGACTVTMNAATSVSGTFVSTSTPAIALTSSANPAFAGQSITLVATLSGSAGSPTGTVTFTADGAAIPGCLGQSLVAGAAYCPTSALTLGPHAILATYSGDSTYAPGTSGVLNESIASPPATTVARLVNISTRGKVLTGNDVMIGGFIIGGSGNKTVVVRARGPSLVPLGIANALANPMLQLVRSSDSVIIATNDDWQNAANAAQVSSSGFAPSNALESAIMTTLPPGAYTAIVSGVGGGTGVGLIEVFEVDTPSIPLINISTRAQVLTGGDVMIGGFIIQGSGPQTVVVRARGPSLIPLGIANAISNPTLQLVRSSDGVTIATNDDWTSSANAAAITASGFAPANSFESAILITLNPGAYTAIVSGSGGGTGVGIVEVFAQ